MINNTTGSPKLKEELNRLLNAAQDKRDFQLSADVMDELKQIEEPYRSEFLALVCLTTSYEKIPEDIRPLAQQPEQLTDAWLRYLNNWLNEPAGMREARSKIVEYTDIIRRAMNSDDGSIAQMGCRCYYSLSRCMLLRNIKETSPVQFLIMIYEKYL